MKAVYVALIEVRPLPGCTVVSSDAIGGIARCYVAASADSEALRKIQEKLASERLSVEKIEWCVRDDEADWENPEDREDRESVKEAQFAEEALVGRIDTWVSEE
jgi:hypothetical protein